MKRLTLKSPMKPSGDQPKAIDALVSGISKNLKHQTLLGVTGSVEKPLLWQISYLRLTKLHWYSPLIKHLQHNFIQR